MNTPVVRRRAWPWPEALGLKTVLAATTSGLLVALVAAMGIAVSSAFGAAPAPAWAVRSDAMPTNISPGSGGTITVLVTNAGGASTDGTPVTITDTLPAGLTVTGANGHEQSLATFDGAVECAHTTSTVTCTRSAAVMDVNTDELVVGIGVAVEPGVSGALTNTVTVSGGGAAYVSKSDPVTVGSQEPSFGFSGAFQANTLDASGALATQAGDHPNAVATTLVLNSIPNPLGAGHTAVQEVKDIVVDLPVGFVGNPQAAPACPEYLIPQENGVGCPAASVIGAVEMTFEGGGWSASGHEASRNISPIFNSVPEHGYPAQFAFDFANQEAALYARLVHTSAGYVVRVISPGISRAVNLTGIRLTFFGQPAAQNGGATAATAFFTNPVDCTQPKFTTTIHMDSWQDPAPVPLNADGSSNFNAADFSDPRWQTATSDAPPVTGCERLLFNPTFSLQPDTTQADSPAGLSVDLGVPQNSDPTGLATPELKDAVVTLPQGLSVNPSSADGLQGCTDAQIALDSTEPASCPGGSQIGTVEIHTPLLDHPLPGVVFLGSPLCGPCGDADAASGRMVRMFIQVNDPLSGVVLKLPGTVAADPATGQLTATFANNPQLPFDKLHLQLKGGPRAPLVTPPGCGTYETGSRLTPWSGSSPATPGDTFQILSGPGGAPCGPLPFAPSFLAGTLNPQAGSFSPFTLALGRADAQQRLSGVQVKLPPGLLGSLRSVERCPEPQASQGTCGAGSLIGHTTVAAGAGSNPFHVGGQVFLTGPYNGAPFGLSIVVPAVAGPFNLGTVIVRAAVNIDPHTVQITVISDPLPTILRGIPLDVRTVNVTVDRPGFIFNPTDCEPLSVGGTLTSTQGTQAQLSSHFQAANCAALLFHPSFTVSTRAKTSKANGASLDVRVGYPSGAQANIHSVAVSLPKQLPSRLTTIQQACPEAVFNQNPASCPAGSNIGVGTATTPVLSNPVVGPAYLVSHGGAAFPDVVVILQGEGVTVDLTGSIDIRHGVTSSTFASVPDVPIGSFDLTLPEGPHSALTTNLPGKAKGSLCGQSLAMPTMITGQNGAVVKQSTRIKVTGCPRAKKKHKAKHGGRHGRRAKKGSLKRGK